MDDDADGDADDPELASQQGGFASYFATVLAKMSLSSGGLKDATSLVSDALVATSDASKPSLTLPQASPVTSWLAGHHHYQYQQDSPNRLLVAAIDAAGAAGRGFHNGKTIIDSVGQLPANESTWSQLLSALFYSNASVSSSEHDHLGLSSSSSSLQAQQSFDGFAINWFNFILALVLIMLMLTTVIGNLFVIVAILIERNLRTIGNYLVLSLAIADLLVALLVMPLAGINQILEGWTMGLLLCDIWTTTDVFCCTASILHLLAIALDRYWAVTRVDYIRCQRNGRRISHMILLVWTAALIISLAPVFGWKDAHFESRITHDKECLISQDIGYQIFATCTTFFFPLTLTLIFYWKIYQVARKRIRRKPGGQRAPKVTQPNPSTSSSTSAPANNHQPNNNQHQHQNRHNHVGKQTGRILNENETGCSCLCHLAKSGAANGPDSAALGGCETRSTFARINSNRSGPNSAPSGPVVGLKQRTSADNNSSSIRPEQGSTQHQCQPEQQCQRWQHLGPESKRGGINLESGEQKNGDNHESSQAGDGAPCHAMAAAAAAAAHHCRRLSCEPDGAQPEATSRGQLSRVAKKDNQILALAANITAQTMEKDASGQPAPNYLHLAQADHPAQEAQHISNGFELSSSRMNMPNNNNNTNTVLAADYNGQPDGWPNERSATTMTTTTTTTTTTMREEDDQYRLRQKSVDEPAANGACNSRLPNNGDNDNDRPPLTTVDQPRQIISGASVAPNKQVTDGKEREDREKERAKGSLDSKRSSQVSNSTSTGSLSRTSSLVNYSAYSNDCQQDLRSPAVALSGAATRTSAAGSAGQHRHAAAQGGGAKGAAHEANGGCRDSLDDCCGCCCEQVSSSNDLTAAGEQQQQQQQLSQRQDQSSRGALIGDDDDNSASKCHQVVIFQRGPVTSSELVEPPMGLPSTHQGGNHLIDSSDRGKSWFDRSVAAANQLRLLLGRTFGRFWLTDGQHPVCHDGSRNSNSNSNSKSNSNAIKCVLLVVNEKGTQSSQLLVGGTCTNCTCADRANTKTTQLNHSVQSAAASKVQPVTVAAGAQSQSFQQQQQLKELAAEGLESKRERKAAKTLAIITGVFVMCWLPFFVMAITMPLLKLKPHKYIFALLLWLGYVNSMLNPIIYTIFSPDFRKAFQRLLCAMDNGGQETPARRAARLNQQIQRQRAAQAGSGAGDGRRCGSFVERCWPANCPC